MQDAKGSVGTKRMCFRFIAGLVSSEKVPLVFKADGPVVVFVFVAKTSYLVAIIRQDNFVAMPVLMFRTTIGIHQRGSSTWNLQVSTSVDVLNDDWHIDVPELHTT